MSKRRKPKTAAELMADLATDPEYLRRMALKRQEHSERFGEVNRQIRPVLAALRAIGYDVESLDELRRDRTSFQNALAILASWLPRVESYRAKEAIVRALSVPWATEVSKTLILEFEKAPATEEFGLKWAIGNALSIVANEEILDDLIGLSLDTKHGRAREMIVQALSNIQDQRSIQVLVNLLKDDQVAGHAIIALGQLHAIDLVEELEPFLQHPKPWIRSAAEQALSEMKRRDV
jgi:HEAT repeat protein